MRDDENEENIFAIIFPENLRNNFLKHSCWTLNSTQFKPEFVHAFGENTEYERWGIESKYEPIIFQRFYNKLYPTKIELIEEFRLYYNLYFDEKNSEYISVDLYSIEKLRIYLENLSNNEQPEIISFFKDLHKLRSVGSAHRKSSDYNKILKKMSIQNKSEIESFKSILKRGISTINLLRNIIEK